MPFFSAKGLNCYCIDDGIEQLVILGAGYDARAYRFDALKQIRVFEVDHPATQRVKKTKLEKILGNLPEHVTFVPVDFEKDELMSNLDESGYCHDLKTLFIWEGVCKYLSSDAVDDVLSMVANQSCKGSSIVFDYLFQSMIDGRSGSLLAQKVLDFQAKKGEPFIFGLPEENSEGYIKAKGFSMVRNAPVTEIKRVYFNNSARADKLHPFWGIIHATV